MQTMPSKQQVQVLNNVANDIAMQAYVNKQLSLTYKHVMFSNIKSN